MKNLAAEIGQTKVPEGGAAIWWLAQAGFVFKSHSGKVIYLDPYLSELVERVANFKRMTLSPIDAEDVRADWFIATHEHPDHLDTDALPTIVRNNPNCKFAGPDTCTPEFSKAGVPESNQLLLTVGNEYRLDDVKLLTARADHGELAPSALAILLDFGKTKVMFTGDTSMHPEWQQSLIDQEPNVLIPCINPAFGNLGETGAAQMTAIVSPKVVLPCHFWMFKEHGGDPEQFLQECTKLCPNVDVTFLTPGQGLIVTGDLAEVL